MNSVLVKICGITNIRDAEAAMEWGADAVGLVFAPSPRQVSVSQASAITRALGPWVASVGVFVNERPETIKRIAEQCQLSAIQLHGDESASVARALQGRKVIKAFRIDQSFDFKSIRDYPADAYLFDAKVNGRYGGTGKSFDWRLLKAKKIARPMIISGGLGPDNVREVTRLLKPYGVEASSGVEKSPGKKDLKLLRKFIKNAKQK